MGKNILTIDRLRRVLLSYTHDVAMSAISFIVALYLRLGSDIISWPRDTIFSGITIFTIVSAVVFFWMRFQIHKVCPRREFKFGNVSPLFSQFAVQNPRVID